VIARIVAGVVVLAAVVTGALVAFRPRADGVLSDPTPTSSLPAIRAVPAPTDLEGVVVDGAAVFSWANPDPQEGDSYLWGRSEAGTETALEIVQEPTVSVPLTGGTACVEVAIVRADGRYSNEPAVGCVDA